MVLAGGSDMVLPSRQEADRLAGVLPRAFAKVLPRSGHALLHEPGLDVVALMRQEGFYVARRRLTSDPAARGGARGQRRGRRGGEEEAEGPGAVQDVNGFGSPGPIELPTPQVRACVLGCPQSLSPRPGPACLPA